MGATTARHCTLCCILPCVNAHCKVFFVVSVYITNVFYSNSKVSFSNGTAGSCIHLSTSIIRHIVCKIINSVTIFYRYIAFPTRLQMHDVDVTSVILLTTTHISCITALTPIGVAFMCSTHYNVIYAIVIMISNVGN